MRTIIPAVMAPVFVLVLMTFVLLLMTGYARFGDLRERRLRIADIALGQNAWPDRTMQISNAFNNQFQIPILFYLLVGFVLLTGKQDYFFIVAQWLFVISRIGHAYIHVTSNHVQQRFSFYLVGAVILMLMWVWYAIRILAAL